MGKQRFARKQHISIKYAHTRIRKFLFATNYRSSILKANISINEKLWYPERPVRRIYGFKTVLTYDQQEIRGQLDQ